MSSCLFASKILKTNQLLRLSQTIRLFHQEELSRALLEKYRFGRREYVGYGWSGEPGYLDRFDFPFPSIRFRACNPDIMALREKERGDWGKLSVEEKKALYRASFCQTFAEMNAPTSEWKNIIGHVLIWLSVSLWLSIFVKTYILNQAPESFSREHRIAQYYRQVYMNAQPISGVYRPPGAEYRENKYNPLNKSFTPLPIEDKKE